MGGGPLAILPIAAQLGQMAFGGGAQAAPAPAAGGTPFDGAFTGGAQQPPTPAPPMPQRAPGAQLTGGPTPPMPGRGAPPMPGRNMEMFGGAVGADYVPGEFEMNPELGAPQSTHMRTPPAEADPYALAKRAGYSTDTVYASEVNAGDTPPVKTRPSPQAAAPKGLFGELDAPDEADETAPIQAATSSARPQTGPRSLMEPDDENDAGEDVSLDEDGEEETPGLVRRMFGGEAGDFMGTLQDKLGDSSTNPLFQVGMGLLASGYDGSNPYAHMTRGLGAIPGQQIAAQNADLAVNADRRAGQAQGQKAKEQQQQDELAALLAAIGAKYGAQGPMTPQSAVARGGAKVIK